MTYGTSCGLSLTDSLHFLQVVLISSVIVAIQYCLSCLFQADRPSYHWKQYSRQKLKQEISIIQGNRLSSDYPSVKQLSFLYFYCHVAKPLFDIYYTTSFVFQSGNPAPFRRFLHLQASLPHDPHRYNAPAPDGKD